MPGVQSRLPAQQGWYKLEAFDFPLPPVPSLAFKGRVQDPDSKFRFPSVSPGGDDVYGMFFFPPLPLVMKL